MIMNPKSVRAYGGAVCVREEEGEQGKQGMAAIRPLYIL